jgi:queuine tRNA-ribosyltransferase
VSELTIPRFEVVAECPHTRARAGLLHTAHGVIETPAFMPVGTYGSVKSLTPRMLQQDLDAKIILANTYHLYLRPGPQLIARLGGLHGFMSWDRAILTDSGGFQVFSLSGFRKIREEGVEFQSHLDGSKHVFTPESTVDVQRALGSDIMMVLDECPAYEVGRDYARQSMERTVRWARAAFNHWRNGARPEIVPNPCQALFPIVQGGMHADLRRECAAQLVELDAAGYAMGGLSVGEPRELSYDMVESVESALPRDRPRYVMGVGMLHELGEYVARGTDMMDCVLPTRNARNGYFFTSAGRLVIKNSRYANDEHPIDESCSCYCCRNFTRAYLRHLFLAKEILFSTLASLHNLHAYLDTMRRIREAILIGNLPESLSRLRSMASASD